MFFYIIYVHIITKLNISITYNHKFKVLSELFCWKSAGDGNHKQSLTRMAASKKQKQCFSRLRKMILKKTQKID